MNEYALTARAQSTFRRCGLCYLTFYHIVTTATDTFTNQTVLLPSPHSNDWTRAEGSSAARGGQTTSLIQTGSGALEKSLAVGQQITLTRGITFTAGFYGGGWPYVTSRLSAPSPSPPPPSTPDRSPPAGLWPQHRHEARRNRDWVCHWLSGRHLWLGVKTDLGEL